MPTLTDKVAIVTGAGRGIGEAVARAFAAAGARVVVTDLCAESASSVAASIGEHAIADPLDVREGGDWARVVGETLDAFGRLDIVVNNAGITGLGPGEVESPSPDASLSTDAPPRHDPEHASLEAWHAVMRTNLDGVFLGCQHAIRGMRRSLELGSANAGSIINIGSRSGVVGIPRAAAYAASKAGVRNHTKSVALYCAEEGLPIRCNVVQPAAVLTPMWDPMLGEGADRERNMEAIVADTPLRRFAEPGEVAAMCVYLASDDSAYVTGAEFTIDGGLLAGSAATPKGNAATPEGSTGVSNPENDEASSG